MALVPNNNNAIASPVGPLVVRGLGQDRWLLLPTGGGPNRRLLQSLCINDDERRVAAMPSRDIEVRLPPHEDVNFFVAKVLRREGYFRAVLVQSRGVDAAPCRDKCGNPNLVHKFRSCVRLANFQGGACAECVWQSHGRRCTHAAHTD